MKKIAQVKFEFEQDRSIIGKPPLPLFTILALSEPCEKLCVHSTVSEATINAQGFEISRQN